LIASPSRLVHTTHNDVCNRPKPIERRTVLHPVGPHGERRTRPRGEGGLLATSVHRRHESSVVAELNRRSREHNTGILFAARWWLAAAAVVAPVQHSRNVGCKEKDTTVTVGRKQHSCRGKRVSLEQSGVGCECRPQEEDVLARRRTFGHPRRHRTDCVELLRSTKRAS
jgi:hypothetical protein